MTGYDDHDDDAATVRRLLSPHDPSPVSTLTQEDLRQVRARVHPPLARRTVSWVSVAAAVVALMVGLVVPFARPPASWALDEIPDGVRIRVELPGFYQRGPDPAEVVGALRIHDVPVDVVYGRDFTPWKAGRITAVGWEYAPAPAGLPQAMEDGFADPSRLDYREYGLQFHEGGGFSIFPSDFEGRVTIYVAVAPWQRVPPPRTAD